MKAWGVSLDATGKSGVSLPHDTANLQINGR
jgi:hypothetical protein